MAVETVNPTNALAQGIAQNGANVREPTAADEKVFARLLQGYSQIKPEQKIVQLINNMGLSAQKQMDSVANIDPTNVKQLLTEQLLVSKLMIGVSFAAKVVGSISQSINKLDTMA